MPDNERVQIRQHVATYPTDLLLRFEYAKALCRCHDYGAAIPELQYAMGNPHLRLRALALLAEAFDAEGMADLAASTREQLAKSGDEGDAGSAPIPAPTRPVTPLDSSSAKRISDEDESASGS